MGIHFHGSLSLSEYGLKDESKPHDIRINKKYGDLPFQEYVILLSKCGLRELYTYTIFLSNERIE